MAAGTWNFNIEQGSTYFQQLIWTDNSNNPVPMQGCTAHMQLRNGPLLTLGTKDILYLDMTTANGAITLGAADGTILLALTASQTAALTFTQAFHDLHIISPNGAVVRLLQGTVTLSPEITLEASPGSQVISGGSGSISTKLVNANYTMSVSDYVVFVDATANAFNVQLPTATGFSDVFVISSVTSNGNLTTVLPAGSETIAGKSSVTVGSASSLAQYAAVTLVSDGAKWWII